MKASEDDKELKAPVEGELGSTLSANEGNHNTTSVVPVWVSMLSNPENEKLVYALLDTQSDITLMDDKLCDELSADTDPVKLRLTTVIGKSDKVSSRRAKGVRIRGYNSAKYIPLTTIPPFYTLFWL